MLHKVVNTVSCGHHIKQRFTPHNIFDPLSQMLRELRKWKSTDMHRTRKNILFLSRALTTSPSKPIIDNGSSEAQLFCNGKGIHGALALGNKKAAIKNAQSVSVKEGKADSARDWH